MTVENFQASLSALATRRAFQPFLVELHDGRRFEVDFPSALAFRGGVAVFTQPGSALILFDHESVVSLVSEVSQGSR